MAPLHVHLSSLCRPESARGQTLTRPLSPLMRGDDDGVAGPGWYESSLDLRRGLLVRESGPDDGLLREWREARSCLAIATTKQLPSASVACSEDPLAAPKVRYPGGLDFAV